MVYLPVIKKDVNLSVNGELDFTSSSSRKMNQALGKAKSLESQLGQFMTPTTIAIFMARMFPSPMSAQVRLLDAGAGRGALTTAFIKRWSNEVTGYLEAHAYETPF